MDYTCRYTREERPNLWFPVHRPDGTEVWPAPTRVWSCSVEQHADNVAAGRVWWGKAGRNRMPSLKKYLSEVPEGMPPASVLHHEQVGHTDGAARELRSVVPGVKYTPKPTALIRHLRTIAGTPAGAPCSTRSQDPAALVLRLRRTGSGCLRTFVLIDHGLVFDQILVPRIARPRSRGVGAGANRMAWMHFAWCTGSCGRPTAAGTGDTQGDLPQTSEEPHDTRCAIEPQTRSHRPYSPSAGCTCLPGFGWVACPACWRSPTPMPRDASISSRATRSHSTRPRRRMTWPPCSSRPATSS